MDEAVALLLLADEHLAAADANASAERRSVAYGEARHAAELAGKALLVRAVGHYPKRHEIGALLYQAGVLPSTVEPRQADRLLRAFTRGEYGVFEAPSKAEVAAMIRFATVIVRAARTWPNGRFHEPNPEA